MAVLNIPWSRVIKHFGEQSEDTILRYTFEYYGDKEYARHKSSCGCVVGKWKDNKLEVSFDTQSFDRSSLPETFYRQANKVVTVFWKDGTHQLLHLRAIVYPNEIML